MEKIQIRDPGWKKVGPGIRGKHPGSAVPGTGQNILFLKGCEDASLKWIRLPLFTSGSGSGSDFSHYCESGSLLIKVMRICDQCSTDPPELHCEPPRLQCERPRSSMGPFWASLAPFFFFFFNADSDPASKSNPVRNPGPYPPPPRVLQTWTPFWTFSVVRVIYSVSTLKRYWLICVKTFC